MNAYENFNDAKVEAAYQIGMMNIAFTECEVMHGFCRARSGAYKERYDSVQGYMFAIRTIITEITCPYKEHRVMHDFESEGLRKHFEYIRYLLDEEHIYWLPGEEYVPEFITLMNTMRNALDTVQYMLMQYIHLIVSKRAANAVVEDF